jgi:hypothetical protein
MSIKWNHFDNWFVKLTGFAMILCAFAWSGYSVIHHYRTNAFNWEYFPFVVSGLMLVFGAALLAKKAVAGAAEIIGPLLDKLPIFRKAGVTTSSVLVPPQPAQPAKVITTTVTPMPEPPTEGD